MKRIAVVIAGTNRGPQDVTIEPGTTAHDVLNQLSLDGYLLSAKGSQTYYGDDENLYPQVLDGDLLYATSSAEVGVF